MLETMVRFRTSQCSMEVPFEEANGDGLNFLAGRDMDYIRDRATEGTLLAHTEGGVPNLIVEVDGRTPGGPGPA